MTQQHIPAFVTFLNPRRQVSVKSLQHYGHGWIELKNGQRWHPCQLPADLTADLLSYKEDKPKWLLKIWRRLFH